MISRRQLVAGTIGGNAVLAPGLSLAHSLKDVQQDLFDKEKYFQTKNEAAPVFALQNAAGKPVLLEDFRGKVVVLHFIYTGCPDVCPLHAERIGEIQQMVNQTPMKDRVQFITVTTEPKRDTPEILKDYGPTHGVDPATNWTFLTSGPDMGKEQAAYDYTMENSDESPPTSVSICAGSASRAKLPVIKAPITSAIKYVRVRASAQARVRGQPKVDLRD